MNINWKTTGAGIGAIATAAISIWQTKMISPEIITGILAGLGLIFAKDNSAEK